MSKNQSYWRSLLDLCLEYTPLLLVPAMVLIVIVLVSLYCAKPHGNAIVKSVHPGYRVCALQVEYESCTDCKTLVVIPKRDYLCTVIKPGYTISVNPFGEYSGIVSSGSL